MEIPYETTPRRDTGLFNSKLAIWLFLASEVMLFGGLFSAYVFLRVGVIEGVDVPWPWGINVHKTFVVLGFINTLILILSSVFVVFGWVALKERKYRKFQLYTWATVICAAIFMMFKAVEYRSKLTQHFDVRLKDNSLMEGKVIGGLKVPFEVDSGTFSLSGGAPGFAKDVEGDFPTLTVEWTQGFDDTVEKMSAEVSSASQFNSWFIKARTRATQDLVKARQQYRGEIVDKDKALRAGEPVINPIMPNVDSRATFVAAEPFQVKSRFRKVGPFEYGKDGAPDKMTYSDGCVLTGVAGPNTIKFEPHYVDMQLVPIHKQKESMVWDLIGDSHAKDAWYENRDHAYEEMDAYYRKKDQEIPQKFLRGYFINLQSIHDKAHQKGFWEEFFYEFKSAAFGSSDGEHDGHDMEPHHDHEKGHDDKHHDDKHHDDKHAAETGGEMDHGHHVIEIPRDQIKFVNSHGPRNSNYYAIYFTITALHGIHVIGGALVLLYFGVACKKLYKKNPEHLANRVEVGGLFWHFVDLVWIFLFPLMYLL